MTSRKFSAYLLLCGITLVGCGKGTAYPEPKPNVTMQFSSTSFAEGQAIPEKYSAYGENVSPQLSWSKAPEGTRSLVLLVEDPDAPRPDPFVHWLVFNIPASTSNIAEGQIPEGVTDGRNDADSTAYYGPKPPSGTDHYHFKLFAIDQQLTLSQGASKAEVMKAIDGHTLATAELIGSYSH